MYLFITDNPEQLKTYKDTSVFMMEELIAAGNKVFCCEPKDLFIKNNTFYAKASIVEHANVEQLILGAHQELSCIDTEAVFMRKDPPIDASYLNCLYMLNMMKRLGIRVINDPEALLGFNEKFLAFEFHEYMPQTIVTSDINQLHAFQAQHPVMILKPLNAMGGESIHKFEDITEKEEAIFMQVLKDHGGLVMLQEFLPDIFDGDYRILIINGKPFPKTIARIPKEGSFKGNLAAGGTAVGKELTAFQEEVGNKIGKFLMQHGINFCCIDMIGKYLTEVNITSPTGAREIFEFGGENPIKALLENL